MSNINFNVTEMEIQGEAWKAGETVRLKGEAGEAWACTLILGFGSSKGGEPGTWYAKLSRPYAYVSLTGISPTTMVGFETYEVAANLLPQRFDRLGKQREGYSVYTT